MLFAAFVQEIKRTRLLVGVPRRSPFPRLMVQRCETHPEADYKSQKAARRRRPGPRPSKHTQRPHSGRERASVAAAAAAGKRGGAGGRWLPLGRSRLRSPQSAVG